jgi:hypothetical protein
MDRHIYSGYSDHHDDGDDPYGQASGNGHKPIHIFDRGRLLRSSFDGNDRPFATGEITLTPAAFRDVVVN